jgi:hypothetical protein
MFSLFRNFHSPFNKLTLTLGHSSFQTSANENREVSRVWRDCSEKYKGGRKKVVGNKRR